MSSQTKRSLATLQVGWSILIPTAEERARALSTLLPNSSSSSAAAPAAPDDFATTAFSPVECSEVKFNVFGIRSET